jgi:hypothetical protein
MIDIENIPLETYFQHPGLAARIIELKNSDPSGGYVYEEKSDTLVLTSRTFYQHAIEEQDRQTQEGEEKLDEPEPTFFDKYGEVIHNIICDRIGYFLISAKFSSEIKIAKAILDSLVSAHFWLPVPLTTMVAYIVQEKYLDRMCKTYGPVASRRAVV